MKGDYMQFDALESKCCLLTGVAGFIGSHTAEALLKAGATVVGVDNFNSYYDPRYKWQNIEEIRRIAGISTGEFCLHEGDIRDRDFLDNVFQGSQPDLVIHLAACAGVRPSIEDPILYTDVNINGTVNILECLKKYNVKHHVIASSSSVYGNNTKVPFSEEDPVDAPISPYAATKKACELLSHTYHHLYDINTACLRFFTVYGPRQRPDLAIYKFTKNIMEGQPIPFYGDGSTKRDYTYYSDIVAGILGACCWVLAEEKRYSVFNLGESRTISLAQMVATIEMVVKKPAVRDVKPLQPGDVNITFADVSRAMSALGYRPSTSFEDGIRSFVNWYKGHRST